MNIMLTIARARRYSSCGVGFAGAMLKHSLVPLELIRTALPAHGVVLDIGCGEGMLSGMLAGACPGLRVIGVDRDGGKSELARRCAPGNAEFMEKDFLDAEFNDVAGAVINDVLHHHPTDRQCAILKKVADALVDGGILILKEVDAEDRADRLWTTFWDSRLYPQDRLNFHSVQDWRRILFESGFTTVSVHRVRHPWPASRTMFVCRRHPRRKSGVTSPVGHRARVLLTGATGFIGRALAAELLECGLGGRPVDLTVLARDPSRLPDEIVGRCRVIDGDLESIPGREEELQGVSHVFHLAASKDFFAGESIYEKNMRGTRALVAALRKSPVLSRIVFASSIGALDRSPWDPCAAPLDEDSASFASTPYGRSKIDGERLLEASGLPWTVLRIPWCYGPGMTPITHVRKLSEMALKGAFVTRFDWPGKVSVIEVRECARALAFIAVEERARNQVLFVTDGEPISIGALMRGADCGGASAGRWRLPRPLVKMARGLRGFLPLTLKSLVMDVLVADDGRLRAMGFMPRPRRREFLVPLLRAMARERRPGMAFSTAVITGAASGIGRSVAARLAASGRRVVLVDLDPAVSMLADILEESEALQANLTIERDRLKVRERISSPDCTWVVNCAGVGVREQAAVFSKGRVRDMLELNITALVELSGAALDAFREKGSGVLVNIASSAAFQPLPGMAAYAASKAFVLSFSEAASAEQGSPGICVLTVCPGGVDTAFQKNSGVSKDAAERLLSPSFVAAAIVRAGESGESRTLLIGLRPYLMSLLSRLLPRRTNLALWAALMKKYR